VTQDSYRSPPAPTTGMTRRIQLARRLGVASVALTFLLMILGAWVKANDAGLSCPDWPACYGEWLPPFPSYENGGTWDTDGDGDLDPITYTQAQVLYEWTHRAVVGIIIVPVAAFALVTGLSPQLRPALRRLPAAAVGIYFLQAALGAITVITGNPPWATTMHLAMAVVWFATLLVATCFAFLAPLPVAKPEQENPFGPRPGTPGMRFVYPGEETAGPPALYPGEEPRHG